MCVHHEMNEKEKLYFINCIALAFFLQDPEASALALAERLCSFEIQLSTMIDWSHCHSNPFKRKTL